MLLERRKGGEYTADISMTYSSLLQLATEIRNIQGEFDSMRTNLDSLVSSVDGQWQGKAQTEFAAAYSTLKSKLDSISTVLGQYATEISKVASCQEETENVAAAGFKLVTTPTL